MKYSHCCVLVVALLCGVVLCRGDTRVYWYYTDSTCTTLKSVEATVDEWTTCTPSASCSAAFRKTTCTLPTAGQIPTDGITETVYTTDDCSDGTVSAIKWHRTTDCDDQTTYTCGAAAATKATYTDSECVASASSTPMEYGCTNNTVEYATASTKVTCTGQARSGTYRTVRTFSDTGCSTLATLESTALVTGEACTPVPCTSILVVPTSTTCDPDAPSTTSGFSTAKFSSNDCSGNPTLVLWETTTCASSIVRPSTSRMATCGEVIYSTKWSAAGCAGDVTSVSNYTAGCVAVPDGSIQRECTKQATGAAASTKAYLLAILLPALLTGLAF